METTTIVLVVVAAVFGGLWFLRRRSRLRSDQFE